MDTYILKDDYFRILIENLHEEELIRLVRRLELRNEEFLANLLFLEVKGREAKLQ